MTTNVKRAQDNQWSTNLSTAGWKVALLSGEYTPTFISDATVKCRCGAGVNYPALVSDDIVEYLVLSGTLNVNGVDLHEGDYASVEGGVDGCLSSAQGMECVCIVHGTALRTSEVFRLISSASLTEDEARKLLKLPWIDHLRRHASPAETEILCAAIKDSPSDSVRELSINIARNISSPKLNAAVRRVFESPRNLAMRISTLLFLASKGDIGPDEWEEQLKVLAANVDEVVDVVSSFYAVNDFRALRNIIETRIASGKYEYNYTLYEFLIDHLKGKA